MSTLNVQTSGPQTKLTRSQKRKIKYARALSNKGRDNSSGNSSLRLVSADRCSDMSTSTCTMVNACHREEERHRWEPEEECLREECSANDEHEWEELCVPAVSVEVEGWQLVNS